MTNEPALPLLDRRRDAGRVRRLFFAGTGFEPALVAKSRDGLKDRLDWVVEILTAAKRLGARFQLDLFGVERETYAALMPGHSELLDELGDDVIFHGREPHSTLLQSLEQADFSIFLRKETRTTLAGFPTKYAESIAYGTPVITNAMPSIAPYHRQGETGFLIDPSDRDRAAAEVVEILALPGAEIDRMKSACAAAGLFHYSNYSDDVRRWLDKLRR